MRSRPIGGGRGFLGLFLAPLCHAFSAERFFYDQPRATPYAINMSPLRGSVGLAALHGLRSFHDRFFQIEVLLN